MTPFHLTARSCHPRRMCVLLLAIVCLGGCRQPAGEAGPFYAGKTVKLRFLVDYNGGSVFVADNIGWFFDDVAFTNTKEAAAPVVSNVAPNTTSFQFNPANSNTTYNLEVQPQFFGSGPGEWGPSKQVTSPK